MSKATAFITYESHWFPAGGVAAVMRQLRSATEAATNLKTAVITPLHEKSATIRGLDKQEVCLFELRYDDQLIPIKVFHFRDSCSWYFLDANLPAGMTPQCFTGMRHPYDVPKEVLIRDSLVFGAAVVNALPHIAAHCGLDPDATDWDLFAQDWEAATTALSFVSQTKTRGKVHLTLHNSYDEYADARELAKVGIVPALCPGDTILHRAWSVVSQHVFTVSSQFALDLSQDLLQRDVMAPHLQPLLRSAPVLGVDNGPFVTLGVGAAELRAALSGDFGAVQAWKAESRLKALAALDAHVHSENTPVWGDKAVFRRGESTWVVMAGRDDPRQKGYDVAAAAVSVYLSIHHGQPECAQFLFFPVLGDEGFSGLTFLKELAEAYPGDVIVFPFIWREGYMAALRAAAFGLMPSLYEPFGMANEFYLAGGCVGIARATGGNLEQIVPLRASSTFSLAVQRRADRYHALSSQPTGILFRESDRIESALDDWRGINAAQYKKDGSHPSRVDQRRDFAVFREMTAELRIAIEDGIRIHQADPALYYNMLADGISHIQRTFAWRRVAQEYTRKIGYALAGTQADVRSAVEVASGG